MTVWGQCSHSTTILWHRRTCGKRFRAQIGCLEATRVAMLSIIPRNVGEKTYLSHLKKKKRPGAKPLLGCMKEFRSNGLNSKSSSLLVLNV